jgi:hypothetical protein
VPLYFGDSAVFEERWGWQNGLPVPQPARSTAELESWLATGQEPNGTEAPADWHMAAASVTARQGGVEPLRLVVLPRTASLVMASVLVFLGGLLLSRLRARDVWVILLLGMMAAAALGFAWPQPAWQFLALALPGLVPLALVLGLQRYLQWRYRWRLAHMPAFSRNVTSTMVRSGSSLRPQAPVNRETSTIDSPAVQSEPWAPSST